MVPLDAMVSASDYVQLHQGDKETLLGSLERIRRTAAEIIEGIQQPETSRPQVDSVRAKLPQATAA